MGSLAQTQTHSQRTSDTHTADDTRIDTHLVQHNTDIRHSTDTAQTRQSAQPSHSLFVYILNIKSIDPLTNVLCTKANSSLSDRNAVSAVREVDHLLVDLIPIAHRVIHHNLHQIERHSVLRIHHAHARENILPNRQQRQPRGPIIGQ